jgi:hypothetical protein
MYITEALNEAHKSPEEEEARLQTSLDEGSRIVERALGTGCALRASPQTEVNIRQLFCGATSFRIRSNLTEDQKLHIISSAD